MNDLAMALEPPAVPTPSAATYKSGYKPIWWLYLDAADAEDAANAPPVCWHLNADWRGYCPDCGAWLTRAFTKEQLERLKEEYGTTFFEQDDD